jgi:hypothetical protein
VVDRIRRFVGMRANLNYNSVDHEWTPGAWKFCLYAVV